MRLSGRDRLLSIGAIALAVAIPLGSVLASIRTSSRNIVIADDVVNEDLYAVGGRTIVEGTVRGDLVVAGGELTITGTVEGDVLGLVAGPVRITGVVGGSVRVAAVSLQIDGSVGGDVASLVGEAGVDGSVARDVLLIGGEGVIGAEVARDVRAQVWRLEIDGDVGRKVVARVDDLVLSGGATVGDDLSFKASGEVDIAPDAVVGGEVIQREVLAPVWAKAVTRAFAWLSLLGLLVSGLLLFWVFPATAARAPAIAAARPGRSALIGSAVLVLPPLLTLGLALSLVGLPVAVLLLVVWLVALLLGPIPAVAWLGTRILGGKGGLVGGFVLGALVWRGAMWLLPVVAAALYLAALTVGVGSFAMAAWEQRRRSIPAAVDWRPLAPAGE
jgi:hypothetical protein